MGQEPKLHLVRPASRQHPRRDSKPDGQRWAPKPATVFAADTNSCTLSRQSENIAAVRVELGGPEGLQRASKEGKGALEGLPTRETGLDIMPPLDVVAFVSFPAQQNHAAVPHRGKINQSVVVVF